MEFLNLVGGGERRLSSLRFFLFAISRLQHFLGAPTARLHHLTNPGIIAGLLLLAAVSVFAINPIIPSTGTFLCDPEAHVWPGDTNTLWVYGSHDSLNDTAVWGCTNNLHVFSTTDLVNWTDHGAVLRSSGALDDIPWTDRILYAPDCAYKDGKWYLYFPFAGSAPEGVATAPSPGGPFGGAVPTGIGSAIDPAVVIDDDGQGYLYWGQNWPTVARLKPGLMSVDSSTMKRLPVTNGSSFLFLEGSSIRKIDSTWYFIYAQANGSRDNALAYATGPTPFGPFTCRGVIIDNTGCDPAVSNNHGSICRFHGKWYVFYHRSTRNSVRNRRLCVEPITINLDGTIPTVPMTSQGASGPLSATGRIEAEVACGLTGSSRIQDCSEGGEEIGGIQPGNSAVYRYLDFGGGVSRFSARILAGRANSRIELHLDSLAGTLVGTLTVPDSSPTWTTATCAVAGASGVHALYLKFVSSMSRINWFQFTPIAGSTLLTSRASAQAITLTHEADRIRLTLPQKPYATRLRFVLTDLSGKLLALHGDDACRGGMYAIPLGNRLPHGRIVVAVLTYGRESFSKVILLP